MIKFIKTMICEFKRSRAFAIEINRLLSDKALYVTKLSYIEYKYSTKPNLYSVYASLNDGSYINPHFIQDGNSYVFCPEWMESYSSPVDVWRKKKESRHKSTLLIPILFFCFNKIIFILKIYRYISFM